MENISDKDKLELQQIADTEIEALLVDFHKVLNKYYADKHEEYGRTVTLLMAGRAINALTLTFYGGLEDLHEEVLKKYERDNG